MLHLKGKEFEVEGIDSYIVMFVYKCKSWPYIAERLREKSIVCLNMG